MSDVRREARIVDPLDGAVRNEEPGQLECVLRLRAHPQDDGLHSAVQEKSRVGVQDRTGADPALADRVEHRLFARGEAGGHVRVPVQIFRRRMEHQVKT